MHVPVQAKRKTANDLTDAFYFVPGSDQTQKTSDDEGDFESRDFSNVISDKDLFKACGGRTAHKGAISTMNGKLKRAAGIGLGLPEIDAVQDDDEGGQEQEAQLDQTIDVDRCSAPKVKKLKKSKEFKGGKGDKKKWSKDKKKKDKSKPSKAER
jgi:hypothetical protein